MQLTRQASTLRAPASRRSVVVTAMAPSDVVRPGGRGGREFPGMVRASPDAAGPVDPGVPVRPGGRGGEGRVGLASAGNGGATFASKPSGVERPAGGAARAAFGGNGGGNPSDNGTGGGNGRGGDGNGRTPHGDGMPPIVFNSLVWAALAGVAYIGNNILSKPNKAAVPATTTATSVRSCCAGKTATA